VPSILVVDDEANIRELVTVYLTAAGFEVRQAVDGPPGSLRRSSNHPTS
jgi:DNA-binding response OmpR family regulator